MRGKKERTYKYIGIVKHPRREGTGKPGNTHQIMGAHIIGFAASKNSMVYLRQTSRI